MFDADNGIKIELVIPDINTFYTECEIMEDTGNKEMYNRFTEKNHAGFTGLSLEDIHKYKYFYPQSKRNNMFDNDIFLSGSKKNFKFNDTDGEDMNMDRFVENLPFIKKTIRSTGDSSGKFIDIYINIAEHYGVGKEAMEFKAKVAIDIVDLLESLGYKVNLYSRIEIKHLGSYKGKPIDYIEADVLIKSSDQPLIKSVIYTTISPWFFRHWWFLFLSAKFNTNEGMGQPVYSTHKSTKSKIYINSGECLNKEDSKQKINEIESLFLQEDNMP